MYLGGEETWKAVCRIAQISATVWRRNLLVYESKSLKTRDFRISVIDDGVFSVKVLGLQVRQNMFNCSGCAKTFPDLQKCLRHESLCDQVKHHSTVGSAHSFADMEKIDNVDLWEGLKTTGNKVKDTLTYALKDDNDVKIARECLQILFDVSNDENRTYPFRRNDLERYVKSGFFGKTLDSVTDAITGTKTYVQFMEGDWGIVAVIGKLQGGKTAMMLVDVFIYLILGYPAPIMILSAIIRHEVALVWKKRTGIAAQSLASILKKNLSDDAWNRLVDRIPMLGKSAEEIYDALVDETNSLWDKMRLGFIDTEIAHPNSGIKNITHAFYNWTSNTNSKIRPIVILDEGDLLMPMTDRINEMEQLLQSDTLNNDEAGQAILKNVKDGLYHRHSQEVMAISCARALKTIGAIVKLCAAQIFALAQLCNKLDDVIVLPDGTDYWNWNDPRITYSIIDSFSSKWNKTDDEQLFDIIENKALYGQHNWFSTVDNAEGQHRMALIDVRYQIKDQADLAQRFVEKYKNGAIGMLNIGNPRMFWWENGTILSTSGTWAELTQRTLTLISEESHRNANIFVFGHSCFDRSWTAELRNGEILVRASLIISDNRFNANVVSTGQGPIGRGLGNNGNLIEGIHVFIDIATAVALRLFHQFTQQLEKGIRSYFESPANERSLDTVRNMVSDMVFDRKGTRYTLDRPSVNMFAKLSARQSNTPCTFELALGGNRDQSLTERNMREVDEEMRNKISNILKEIDIDLFDDVKIMTTMRFYPLHRLGVTRDELTEKKWNLKQKICSLLELRPVDQKYVRVVVAAAYDQDLKNFTSWRHDETYRTFAVLSNAVLERFNDHFCVIQWKRPITRAGLLQCLKTQKYFAFHRTNGTLGLNIWSEKEKEPVEQQKTFEISSVDVETFLQSHMTKPASKARKVNGNAKSRTHQQTAKPTTARSNRGRTLNPVFEAREIIVAGGAPKNDACDVLVIEWHKLPLLELSFPYPTKRDVLVYTKDVDGVVRQVEFRFMSGPDEWFNKLLASDRRHSIVILGGIVEAIKFNCWEETGCDWLRTHKVAKTTFRRRQKDMSESLARKFPPPRPARVGTPGIWFETDTNEAPITREEAVRLARIITPPCPIQVNKGYRSICGYIDNWGRFETNDALPRGYRVIHTINRLVENSPDTPGWMTTANMAMHIGDDGHTYMTNLATNESRKFINARFGNASKPTWIFLKSAYIQATGETRFLDLWLKKYAELGRSDFQWPTRWNNSRGNGATCQKEYEFVYSQLDGLGDDPAATALKNAIRFNVKGDKSRKRKHTGKTVTNTKRQKRAMETAVPKRQRITKLHKQNAMKLTLATFPQNKATVEEVWEAIHRQNCVVGGCVVYYPSSGNRSAWLRWCKEQLKNTPDVQKVEEGQRSGLTVYQYICPR